MCHAYIASLQATPHAARRTPHASNCLYRKCPLIEFLDPIGYTYQGQCSCIGVCGCHARSADEDFSIFALRRRQALKDANITHVISALRLPLEKEPLNRLEHLVVEVNDLEEENIIEYLPACIAFIQQGLDSGGGVLVHW